MKSRNERGTAAPLQDSDELRLSKTDGIATLTLRRGPLNVLNIALMRLLTEILVDPATCDNAAVLALKAEGKAFCAGVDVADHSAERTKEMLSVFHELIYCLQNLAIPTVALVEGAALGGGFELALACDMIIASDKAKFGVPEITLAVFPPFAMVELPAMIGMKKAAELILTGKIISAEESKRLGIVNEIFATEQFAEQAAAFLKQFTKLSRTSLGLTKKTLMESAGYADKTEALKHAEKRYFDDLMNTADAIEGITAFMEKRPPVWSQSF